MKTHTPQRKRSSLSKGPGPLKTDMKTFYLMMFADCRRRAQDLLYQARTEMRMGDAAGLAISMKYARSFGEDCRRYLADAAAA